MKQINKQDRGFYWTARAWYCRPDIENEIMFGLYPEGGNEGTLGEMAMRWIVIGKEKAPRLECYCDAFAALASFTDLIEALGIWDGDNFSQEQFVKLLLSLGFKDLTPYSDPYTKTENQKQL